MIKGDANGQYVAFRTRSESNPIGKFNTLHMYLEKWPDLDNWQSEKVKESKIEKSFMSIHFIFIDAQRDIYQDLREKNSFVGKVLSKIEYDNKVMSDLEKLIKEINDTAVNKSNELKLLTFHLKKLNQSLKGSSDVEITPLPMI